MIPSELAVILDKLSDARQRLCIVTLIAEIMGDVIQESRAEVIKILQDGDESTVEEFFDLLEGAFSNVRTIATCCPAQKTEELDADWFFRDVTAKHGKMRNTREDLN